MIIDYTNKEQMASLNIEESDSYGRVYIQIDDNFDGVTFKNFPTIAIRDSEFKNCIFENCKSLEFSECTVYDSTFKNIAAIEGHYTDFHGCTFSDCCSDGPFLVIDSEGEIEGCTFENITASGEDGYIISCIYNSQSAVREISNCRFINCKVENEYDELVECRYMKHGFGNKTVYEDNIDYDTCVFENN
jgi:hypothetical protein